MRILLSLVFLVGASVCLADELDGEQGVVNVKATGFEGTVIIRVDTATKEVSRLVVEKELSTKAELLDATHFVFDKVGQQNITDKELSELDKDAGQSSWHYYWPRYRYWKSGYYYNYGRYYRPFHSYRRGTYYFYYYNRWYRWY